MADEIRDNFISTEDAAQLLGYSVQHTRLLLRKGHLPATKLGRDWFIAQRAVTEYLAERSTGVRAYSAPQQLNFGQSLTSPTSGKKELTPQYGDALLTAVNVAQVPQRSPFRYPGGKTWLVPQVRTWLNALGAPVPELIEPFAGGGIVSLTAVFEGLAHHATMVELDEDVAAVWHTILSGNAAWLAERIASFHLSAESVRAVLAAQEQSVKDHAFATILKNRVARGGILAPGAGFAKRGEDGRGLSSRWYPDTLRRRIIAIANRIEQITFIQGDGMEVIRDNAHRADCAFFIDPPYTVAGKRLYKYSDLDHTQLFALASTLQGDFLMTYDNAHEIRALAAEYGFATRLISMKTTHHTAKRELLIGRALDWLPG